MSVMPFSGLCFKMKQKCRKFDECAIFGGGSFVETMDLKALEDAVLSDLETQKFHRKITGATHLYHRCRLLACPWRLS